MGELKSHNYRGLNFLFSFSFLRNHDARHCFITISNGVSLCRNRHGQTISVLLVIRTSTTYQILHNKEPSSSPSPIEAGKRRFLFSSFARSNWMSRILGFFPKAGKADLPENPLQSDIIQSRVNLAMTLSSWVAKHHSRGSPWKRWGPKRKKLSSWSKRWRNLKNCEKRGSIFSFFYCKNKYLPTSQYRLWI